MSNTLKKIRESRNARIAGTALSLGILTGMLAGCSSEQDPASQPSASTSATAEVPTPEASVQPTETSSPEATVTLSDGFVVSEEIANIAGFTSAQEAYEAYTIYEDFAVKSGEIRYFDTNDILINALTTGDLTAIANKYNVDKDEVDKAIATLLSIIESPEAKRIKDLEYDQIQQLLDVHLFYLPGDSISRFKANMLLLDALRHHENYEDTIPDVIDECAKGALSEDSIVGEPLGVPGATRELFTCSPGTEAAKAFVDLYGPEVFASQLDMVLKPMLADDNLTADTKEIMSSWYSLITRKFVKTEY